MYEPIENSVLIYGFAINTSVVCKSLRGNQTTKRWPKSASIREMAVWEECEFCMQECRHFGDINSDRKVATTVPRFPRPALARAFQEPQHHSALQHHSGPEHQW